MNHIKSHITREQNGKHMIKGNNNDTHINTYRQAHISHTYAHITHITYAHITHICIHHTHTHITYAHITHIHISHMPTSHTYTHHICTYHTHHICTHHTHHICTHHTHHICTYHTHSAHTIEHVEHHTDMYKQSCTCMHARTQAAYAHHNHTLTSTNLLQQFDVLWRDLRSNGADSLAGGLVGTRIDVHATPFVLGYVHQLTGRGEVHTLW